MINDNDPNKTTTTDKNDDIDTADKESAANAVDDSEKFSSIDTTTDDVNSNRPEDESHKTPITMTTETFLSHIEQKEAQVRAEWALIEAEIKSRTRMTNPAESKPIDENEGSNKSEPSPKPEIRRSERIRQKLMTSTALLAKLNNQTTEKTTTIDKNILIPKSYKQAMTTPQWQYWQEAAIDEVTKLTELDAFELVPKPTDRKVIDGRWVFTNKKDTEGRITDFKARYCAKGFSQVYGQDYHEVYAPTLSADILRAVLTHAAIEDH